MWEEFIVESVVLLGGGSLGLFPEGPTRGIFLGGTNSSSGGLPSGMVEGGFLVGGSLSVIFCRLADPPDPPPSPAPPTSADVACVFL